MLRNPLIILYDSTTSILSIRYLPISSAVCSGDFLDNFKNGNTTTVISPSNSDLVF